MQLIWGYKMYILVWNNWIIFSHVYEDIELHNQNNSLQKFDLAKNIFRNNTTSDQYQRA